MDTTEELELVTIIKNAPDSAEAEHARERLREAHRPFVRKIAKGHCRTRRQNLDDLENAGWRG